MLFGVSQNKIILSSTGASTGAFSFSTGALTGAFHWFSWWLPSLSKGIVTLILFSAKWKTCLLYALATVLKSTFPEEMRAVT